MNGHGHSIWRRDSSAGFFALQRQMAGASDLLAFVIVTHDFYRQGRCKVFLYSTKDEGADLQVG